MLHVWFNFASTIGLEKYVIIRHVYTSTTQSYHISRKGNFSTSKPQTWQCPLCISGSCRYSENRNSLILAMYWDDVLRGNALSALLQEYQVCKWEHVTVTRGMKPAGCWKVLKKTSPCQNIYKY